MQKLVSIVILLLGLMTTIHLDALAGAEIQEAPPKKVAISLPVLSRGLSSEFTTHAPKSLIDAFRAAVQRSETIGIQDELIDQAHEVNSQAFGAILPTLNGGFNFLKQETPINATGNSIYPATQNTGKLTADQPLFRGFRDFAGLRQKKYLVDAQVTALIVAARQLFYDLSTGYYNVLAYQRDVINYKKEIEINQKRLTELDNFFKIGRSQLTDVLTFKANIAALESQLELTLGLLEQSKDILAYLTGWDRNVTLVDREILFNPSSTEKDESNSGFGQTLGTPVDISSYLAKLEERPDVQNAISNVKANDEGIALAAGNHLPSVDLIGDYYFFRPGALSNVSWDAQVALTIPLFQGGIVQSQVRQAESVARQYSLLLSQTKRLAEREIRTYYDSVEADRKQALKLTHLAQISKKNYETEINYYRRGLVTNLDVLQAVNTYQDAVRQLDHVRYQFQSDGVKLEAAAGQRTEINIKTPKL